MAYTFFSQDAEFSVTVFSVSGTHVILASLWNRSCFSFICEFPKCFVELGPSMAKASIENMYFLGVSYYCASNIRSLNLNLGVCVCGGGGRGRRQNPDGGVSDFRISGFGFLSPLKKKIAITPELVMILT